MPIVMMMRWPAVSLEGYDEVRRVTKFDTDAPSGGIYHVATHDGENLRVVDVWESAEDFQQFVETRLMPAVAQLGLPGEPQIEVYPVHFSFAPGYAEKG